ncbi:MAG TPA: hypothetical protein VHT75_02235 [Acidimicrobiales bacterium]|nr:hypothetical protein [Acidimicrobiales bacterium]
MTYDGWGSQGKAPPFEGADAIPPGYGPPSYPPPSYPPPPGYGSYPGGYSYPASYAPRTDGTAVAALVLAGTSFVFCPVILAIISLALIPGSRRTITSSGGSITGLGLLTAAKVLSWINIGLVVGAIIIVIIIAASSSSYDSMALFSYRGIS